MKDRPASRVGRGMSVFLLGRGMGRRRGKKAYIGYRGLGGLGS